MAKQCVKTTVGELKEAILAHDGRNGTREALDALERLIGNMPLTICSTAGSRGKSQYNIFISDCMKRKSGPVTVRMKECAAEWRNRR